MRRAKITGIKTTPTTEEELISPKEKWQLFKNKEKLDERESKILEKTVFMFLLIDMLEFAAIDLHSSLEKVNNGLKKGVRATVQKLLEQATKLRKRANIMPIEAQELFGETSDEFYKLIYKIHSLTEYYPEELGKINKIIDDHYSPTKVN